METLITRITARLSLALATSMALVSAAHADTNANSNTVTNTYTYTYTNINSNTQTETYTYTDTQTCTWNGVPVDCKTGLPLTNTNPQENCPDHPYDVIYGHYCDFRITTIKFHPVKIQHFYDGAGFNAGTGLTAAYGMNDNTDIVGQAMNSSGELHAVQLNIGPFYFENHYFTDLGTPGLTSVAKAISNEDTVVGASQASMGASAMVDAIWQSQLGGFTVINALGGISGEGTGIGRSFNYTEYMSGWGPWPTSNGGDGLEHGFVWSFDGTHRTLEIIGAKGQANRALNINDSEIAVGFVMVSGKKNASMWSGGSLAQLPDYGNYTSMALNLNNNRSAKIVGLAFDSTGKKHAMVWQNGTSSVLPKLYNGAPSMALAISDGSDIVGQSGTRAVFWRDGAITDLNNVLDTTLSTTLTQAIDINRHGRILAKGADGAYYLLVPTESM